MNNLNKSILDFQDMTNSKPLVSVVMCTYNGVLYLEDQLKSIMSQSLPAAEVIICDDGSTDGTLMILNDFKEKYPQITVIVNETRLGFNKNFEKVLGLATYDLVAISDQDDIWVSQKLELLSSGFTAGSSVVYCDSVRFKDKITSDLKPTKSYRRVQGTSIKKLFLSNTVSGHAIMIKKEFLQTFLPFPSKGYYDWWIAMVSCCNGGLNYVDKVLVYQRVHQSNQSIKQRPRDVKSNEYKREVIQQLESVVVIPRISTPDKLLSIRLANLLVKTLESGFILQCFYLILKNSNPFFYKTKRFFKLPSIIKYAYYFSTKNNC